MTQLEFVDALFDLSFTAGMNQQWLREDLGSAIFRDNCGTYAVGVIAFLSIVVAFMTPRPRIRKTLTITSIATAVIAAGLFLWTMVDRPQDRIQRLSTLLRGWNDLRADVGDLYIIEKSKEQTATSTEESKRPVSSDLVAALRIIEQRERRLNDEQKELKPEGDRWGKIKEEETERRWGQGIRTKDDLDKKRDELKKDNKPPLELRIL